MNNNVGLGGSLGGNYGQITATACRERDYAANQTTPTRSVIRDQLDRAEKALSQLEATIVAHRERIESALEREGERDDYVKPPHPPCAVPSTGCDLGDRLCRIVATIEDSQSAIARISQRVCL